MPILFINRRLKEKIEIYITIQKQRQVRQTNII